MIDLILFIFVVLALSVLAANNYFHFYRNDKVRDFRMALLDTVSNTAKKYMAMGRDNWFAPYYLYNKYSYDDMVYSFKPLTLEAWYTEEEIKMIKGEDIENDKSEIK